MLAVSAAENEEPEANFPEPISKAMKRKTTPGWGEGDKVLEVEGVEKDQCLHLPDKPEPFHQCRMAKSLGTLQPAHSVPSVFQDILDKMRRVTGLTGNVYVPSASLSHQRWSAQLCC